MKKVSEHAAETVEDFPVVSRYVLYEPPGRYNENIIPATTITDKSNR